MSPVSVASRTRWFASAIAFIGVAMTVALASASHSSRAAAAEDWLEERAQVVEASTIGIVETAINGLSALAAFFENSGEVNPDEFSGFVTALDPKIWLLGVAHMELVRQGDLDAHEARMESTISGYFVSDFDDAGLTVPVDRGRSVYFPVTRLYSGPVLSEELSGSDTDVSDPLLGIGYDAGSPLEWAPSFDYAVTQDSAAVSELLDFSGPSGEQFGKAFIVMVPVHDAAGEVIGLVGAPMVDLVLGSEGDFALTQSVSWEVATSTNVPPPPVDLFWRHDIEFPGTTWTLTVTPTEESLSALAGIPIWISLAIGLVLTAIAVTLFLLGSQRSRARLQVAEMERLGREKDRFLASVSHELRTPLTVVSGLAHELNDRRTDFDGAEVEDLLTILARQSDEVAAIVEDLLVAARADISEVKLHHDRVDLAEEVRRVLDAAVVDAVLIGDPSVGWGDPNRVRQIIRNLVSNALRYGGPEREISFGDSAGRVWVEVADSGPEIGSEQRDRMFRPYVTTSDQRESQSGAMGLGLYISQRLAELMEGSLEYRHGGGMSRFRLTLPAARPEAEQTAA